MSLRIGRVVVERCLSDIKFAGRANVSIVGSFEADSTELAKALRTNLLALDDNDDEPVVPILSDLDPDLNGFWQVENVNVDVVRDRTYRGNMGPHSGRHSFALSARRVRSGSGSRGGIDLITASPGYRRDVVNPTADNPRIWVPAAVGSGELSNLTQERELADGEVVGTLGAGLAGTTSTHAATVPPQQFYDGAARIEVFVDGRWVVLTGRDLPAGVPSDGGIRLSNGIIRATIGFTLRLETWDQTVLRWVQVGEFELASLMVWLYLSQQLSTFDLDIDATIVTVTRNGPRVASVAFGSHYTVTLTTGSPAATVVTSASAADYAIRSKVPTAATATTGGLYSTAKVANRFQWVLVSPVTTSAETNTTTGAIDFQPGVSSSPVLVGVIGHQMRDGTTTFDGVIDGLRGYWWNASSTNMRVVER